ncbi:MAG: dihydrolipoamide acetyltransferase family protein [Armatimonadota bacterium]|nr:dihydrolipoamide acetyltransferase family protein [Armatimonadota bacterium]MDR7518525.1 dihydrolipoamide acetyltransferase family protein [Armatimonadota bacterium]
MPEVIMPKMGDAMTEGKVLRWMKQEGERVKQGEPIAEIETDKVNVDLEAEWDGTLARILVGPGAVAPVGAPIAVIAREGEAVRQPAAPPAPPTPSAAGPTATAPAAKTALPAERAAPGAEAGAVRASPLARRLAAEHGVPLAAITGTGPDGRITKEDVEAYLAAKKPAAAPAPRAAEAAARQVPLSRMRQTIARRMTESKQHVPHFYVTMAVAMDAAMALRRQLNEGLDDAHKVSINDLVVKAAALALVKFPTLNASYVEGALHYPGEINISIAVPVPDGLLVPTLYHCDRKPLWQIAAEARAVIERARNGRLRPDDLINGTFTVSNLGPYDVDMFAAIINPPQAAILAVGAAKPQPVVRDGQVIAATMMHATLATDHRVTDGAEASRFLAEVRRLLENPVWLVTQGPEAR